MQPERHSSNGSTYVEFEQVGKSFDGRTMVVRNLDLSIRKGEFLTLLGPSGSGKTTCLMMLAGFETPTLGTIRIDGRSMNQVPPRLRGIGMVFQNYALFPHMSVWATTYPSRWMCGGSMSLPVAIGCDAPCSS